MPSSLRTSIETARGRTEAHQPDFDRPPRTPLYMNNVARNEGINSDRKESKVEPVQVDEDWKMRSPSPVELTYAPAYFHQLYEDTDIVMTSPSHPPHSPTPEQVQDSATLGSYSDTEPPCSPTPTEVLAQDSSTWTSSSWGVDPPHSPTSKEAQDSGSLGCSPCETDPTQDSWTGGSSSWGTDSPRSSTPEPVQDSST
jgi:hypothetical protein